MNEKFNAQTWESAYEENGVENNVNNRDLKSDSPSLTSLNVNIGSDETSDSKTTESSVENLFSNKAVGIASNVKDMVKNFPGSPLSTKVAEAVPKGLRVFLGLICLVGVILNVLSLAFMILNDTTLFAMQLAVIVLISAVIFLVNSIILFAAKSIKAFIATFVISDLLYLGLSIFILIITSY